MTPGKENSVSTEAKRSGYMLWKKKQIFEIGAREDRDLSYVSHRKKLPGIADFADQVEVEGPAYGP